MPCADAIRIEDLQTSFHTGAGVVRAVSGVSLAIGAGRALAVVGESGSGKSVTGLTVMRLLGRTTARIEAGRVLFRGRDGAVTDLLALPERRMARVRGRDIAMVFQDPMSSLNPVFPVGEQIAETIRHHHGAGRAEARARALALLHQVGINDPARRLDAFPHELSGGMRQRVMIAIALACDPLLLIADEPTTALDVTVQAQVVALLRTLQRERGMAMLFVTHDLQLVAEVADEVAVMYAGQVVEQGPAAALLDRPLHPYTRALLACAPRGRGAPMRPIPGRQPSPLALPPGCRFHPRCALAAPACIAAPPALAVAGPGRVTRCIRWEALD